jgi:hypothetical protein
MNTMPARKKSAASTTKASPNPAPTSKTAQTASPKSPQKAASKAIPKATSKATPKVPAKPPTKKPPKVRPRLVRDGFTMPEADFALIDTLKARAMAGKRAAKKSELLRAGLHSLAALDSKALLAALDQLEPVKIGRPSKAG